MRAATAAIAKMRHSAIVRATHWINALCFVALAVSGVAILIAHPRFYWGWTGYFDTPAAFELPLTVDLDQTGWGRNLHFLAAWITVFNGLVYVGRGLLARHFLGWHGYSRLQKLAYLGVVFVLLPVMTLSGLTMSPGVTAAHPELFDLFGGRQSARTIHFLLGNLLVVFLIGHVAMTIATGFGRNMRAMITAGDA
ncbi:MAG TPA: cytochrome b/b6 domain-containing protein [Bryobacteraceae bacterium]|nr:cytochrome b/b6 domain-containing protein [Bryobacteraceae bacterium]